MVTSRVPTPWPRVRFLPDPLWLWCNGSTAGCDPAGGGSNPLGHLILQKDLRCNMTAEKWLEMFNQQDRWDDSEDVENKVKEYSTAIEKMRVMLDLLEQMDKNEQAKVVVFLETCRSKKLDKLTLILATMSTFNVHFELAEHIVELAIENEDLSKLSLANAEALILEVGNSLVKED